MPRSYGHNDVARVSAVFTDVDGVYTDPTPVQLVVTKPDGSVSTLTGTSTPAVAHDSQGHYHADVKLDQQGTWRYEWQTTDDQQTTVEGELFVRRTLRSTEPDVFAVPTAAEVWAESRLDFTKLGFTGSAELEGEVHLALAAIQEITGRQLDTTLPVNLVPVARQALRMYVEMRAYAGLQDRIDTETDQGIQSFSVPGYSETRRGPEFVRRGGYVAGVPEVTPWAALNDVLFLLMTEEKREFWRAALSGQFPPHTAFVEEDWSGTFPTTLGGGVPVSWPGWGGL